MSSPAQRRLAAQIAAHSLHARCADPAAHTAPARAAGPTAIAYFERQVDPDGVLPAADRLRRAEHARKVYFARLALKSAQARRARKSA